MRGQPLSLFLSSTKSQNAKKSMQYQLFKMFISFLCNAIKFQKPKMKNENYNDISKIINEKINDIWKMKNEK